VIKYDVIIRTFNSELTLGKVLASLGSLKDKPKKIIIIDSGSSDRTLQIAREFNCSVYAFKGVKFNYSAALNQGIQRISEEYCLILSSHVLIKSPYLISIMHKYILKDRPVAYLNMSNIKDNYLEVSHINFDGFNGIQNPCALYKTSILKKIGFEEQLPTAEDQYFAKKLFENGFKTFSIKNCGFAVGVNPRIISKKILNKKIRNECICIAYYSYRRNMSYKSIIFNFIKAVKLLIIGQPQDCYHYATLSLRLIAAWFVRPNFESRYF
jgi:glycosyltransferase involved in cell wall biosynthesis